MQRILTASQLSLIRNELMQIINLNIDLKKKYIFIIKAKEIGKLLHEQDKEMQDFVDEKFNGVVPQPKVRYMGKEIDNQQFIEMQNKSKELSTTEIDCSTLESLPLSIFSDVVGQIVPYNCFEYITHIDC